MRGRFRCVVLVSTVVASGVLGFGVPAAFAEGPWWHVTSGLRPSSLRRGVAKDEVQKVTVEGSEGTFEIIESVWFQEVLEGKKSFFVEPKIVKEVPYNASAAELQVALEKLYGAGNVQVSEVATGSPEIHSWEVTFTGGLADQPVAVMRTINESVNGGVGAEQVTLGVPDGEVVVTAENVGDGNVVAGKDPVVLSDVLPSGLKAVAVAGERPTGLNSHVVLECDAATVSCESTESLPPFSQLEMLVDVVVQPAGASGEVNEAKVTGGGGGSAFARRPIAVGDTPVGFGIENYELRMEEEGGVLSTRRVSIRFSRRARSR